MDVSNPHYAALKLPDIITTAIQERNAEKQRVHSLLNGTIREREDREEFLSASELGHALFMGGLHKQTYPYDPAALYYIVAKSVAIVLCGGALPRIKPDDLISDANLLLMIGWQQLRKERPIDLRTAAALVELFTLNPSGREYDEGISGPIPFIVRNFCTNFQGANYGQLPEAWAHRGLGGALGHVPAWATDDAVKIINTIPLVVATYCEAPCH